MASIINAATSGGLVTTADTSGILQLQTAGTTAVTVTASQNVGIGTDAPTQVLDVRASQGWITATSTTGTLSSVFKSSNTGGSSYFGRDNSTGGVLGSSAYATVVYGSGAYPMTFHTNDTERMRIVAAGNVGIGTSSPATKLDVNGSITTTGAVQFNGTDASMGTGQIKYITGAGLSIYAKTGSGYDFTLFGAAGNNIMRIPTGTVNLDFPQAGVTFNAYGIGLGGTSPSSGTGITFPATQSASTNANTLDDYEEGDWTPNQGSGLTVTGTFASAGTYTKIGRQVFVQGVLAASTLTCAKEAIITSNLPFTTAALGLFCAGGMQDNNGGGLGICGASVTSVYAGSAISATATRFYFSLTYSI